MADVSKIFKPRRGLASTMSGAGKKDIVLAKGEMFVEAPSTGMGTGESKIKIGDGTTAYASLPYALGDTSNNKIEFTSNTSTTVATALNSVASGNALKTIIAGLKQAISLCNTSITQLNDDTNGLKFAQDVEGNWGYIIPGADTVNPFKKGDIKKQIKISIYRHNYNPSWNGYNIGLTVYLDGTPIYNEFSITALSANNAFDYSCTINI